MKAGLFFILNPWNWFRAWRFQRKNAKFDKSEYDLELFLYSKILKNDMLHYGYFENSGIDPESISLKMLEAAQVQYALEIMQQISDKENTILDIGCGMGGLAALLTENHFSVETLTPNVNQFQHLRKKYPSLPCYNQKLEDFKADKKYGTLINAESLQYIPLPEAFAKAGILLMPHGRWIITDYFRLSENASGKSGHLLSEFLQTAARENWRIIFQKDMTLNVLPTLKLVNVYVERFLLPVKHFALEKLRYKKAWLYFMTGKLREQGEIKLNKELAVVDPPRFAAEKKYMLFVLQQKNR